jgi:putative DNA primase/helicase
LSERINTEELLKSVNIIDIIGRRVPLIKKGSEYYGVCPFHDDHDKSLQVNEKKQIYKCFACVGKVGGDAIDFLQRSGLTFHEAIAEIKQEVVSIQTNPEKHKARPKVEKDEWKQVIETPAPPSEIKHYKHGKPSKVYQYRTRAGKLIGYTARFELEDGSKQVLPFVFATNGKKSEWRFHGFDRPRPLYGLEQVDKFPDKTIVVVEGEKTKDAGARLLVNAVVVSWIGGARAIHETDWGPICGRKVILWPDNDKPGEEAMIEIEAILKPHSPVIKWVRNSASFPNKWDIADATDWTADTARDYVRANLYTRGEKPPENPPPATKPEPPKPTPPPALPPAQQPPQQNTAAPQQVDDDSPFRFLGFDKSESGGQRFHFYVRSSGTIFCYSASSLSKTALMTLAPLNHWEQNYPSKRGLDIDAAQMYVIHYGTKAGPFDERRIRGRGAWVEGSNVILHGGDKLIVNGKVTALTGYKSRNIYEAGHELGFNTERPLTTVESAKYLEMVSAISWERPINAYLFAGWTVLAPICGALKWRPHIWLTGGAGTGKSWIMRYIVRLMLGETALSVQSETTEAGIRQILGHDALPVAFDEAEGSERRDSDRIQMVLNLMRAASSEDGGIMAKGSAGGTAKTYRIRSCFAFASISVGVYLHSDRSRVSVLGLVSEQDREKKDTRWKALKELHRNVISEEYCSRLRARTISRLPTIRQNADTFAEAVAFELGEQRAGDQLGTLLAGAYSLVSDKVISYEDACKWVKERDWTEEKNNEESKDEMALLRFLTEQAVKMESAYGNIDRTVAELVSYAVGDRLGQDDLVANPEKAHDRLKRCGIKVDADFLVISNTHDQIRKWLAGTQWSKNHNKILQRIFGAKTAPSVRFGSGVPTRGVMIPLHFVLSKK